MITDLQFEHPVRVGSKSYRIDVLVWRDGAPWAVVECKRPNHTKHSDGIEQALSYAGAENIRAEYAIYTNGTQWLVNRQVNGQWIAVPDIPKRVDRHVGIQLEETLRSLEDVGPLLYKLDEPLENTEARAYLMSLQRFFNGGRCLLTQDVDHQLLFAADNLCRVLSHRKDRTGYLAGKLLAALHSLERYQAAAHLDGRMYVPEQVESIDTELRSMRACLYETIEGTQYLADPSALILRIVAALSDYGISQSPKRPYPQLCPGLHHAVRGFLDFAIPTYLMFELPDLADVGAVDDLRSHFSAHWASVMAQATAR